MTKKTGPSEVVFTRHETKLLLAGGKVLVGGILYSLSKDREALTIFRG